MILGKMLALIVASAVALIGPGMAFSPDAFVLPDGAQALIVVEGTGNGSECALFAYEKDAGGWKLSMSADGYLGQNGMSNNRTCGDRTTPIGVWRADTPFGQKDRIEGFPADYIKVDESYTWDEKTNRLVKDDPQAIGEKVGTSRYKGYYDYVLNMGYNINAVENKGDALFIHCGMDGDTDTSGCIEIAEPYMVELMKLYGRHEPGTVYVACGPKGKIAMLYEAYGVNNGLSPDGDFR